MNEEREKRNQSYYVLRLKAEIYLVLEQVPKRYASYFFQLKIRYRIIRVFLERIRVIKTVDCCWCKQVEQLVDYLYTKYRKLQREKGVLKKELKVLKIRFEKR